MSLSRHLFATLTLPLVLAGSAAPWHAAAALGLGEMAATTPLGAPFEAVIPVSVSPDEFPDLHTALPATLKVDLGSPEDYRRLGVERLALHQQLRFDLELLDGVPHIRVRSREPLREPFLDIVLAVRWPQGQLVRGFTVLLDPAPTVTPALAGAAPRVGPEASRRSMKSAAQAEGGSPRTAAVAQQPPLPLPAGSYETQPGDSLWHIARRWSGGVRINAAIDALIAANPHAFAGGDPERLRVGVTLTLPGSLPAVPSRQLAVAAASPGASSDRGGAAHPVGTDQQARARQTVPPPVTQASVPPAHLELVAAAEPVALAPEHAVYQTRIETITAGVGSLDAELQATRVRLERVDRELRVLVATYDRQGEHEARLLRAVGASGGAGAPASGNAAGFAASTASAAAMAGAGQARWPTWTSHAGYWLAIAALAGWIGWQLRRQRRAAVEPGSPFPAPIRAPRPARTAAGDARRAAAVRTPTASTGAAAASALEQGAAPLFPAGAPMGAAPVCGVVEEGVDAGISAGVFIAFGRMEEAEQVLVEALEQWPDRADLQLQLLDIHIQTGNYPSFEALAAAMGRQHAADEAVLDELSIVLDAYRAAQS